MTRVLAGLLVMVLQSVAAEISAVSIPVDTGTFSIPRLTISGTGKADGFKLRWDGSAINDTGRDWHKVTFCVHAFDTEGNALTSQDACLLRLWIYEWKSGAPANWKGSQKIKIGEGGKREVGIARFELLVEELRTDPESVEVFAQSCDRVWTVALQAFMGEKFRPTVSDKDSLLASFEYEGGQTVAYLGNVNDVVRAFTVAPTGFFSSWDRFRIDSASLLLKHEPDKGCRAEVKMSFAGYSDGGFNKGWFEMASNHQFEKRILKATAEKVSQDYEKDLDHAISQLPTSGAPPQPKSTEGISVSITSDPAPTDIEIDGEYVGSTPSTLSLSPGTHAIVLKKRGFESWQRELSFRLGEERAVHGELEQKP